MRLADAERAPDDVEAAQVVTRRVGVLAAPLAVVDEGVGELVEVVIVLLDVVELDDTVRLQREPRKSLSAGEVGYLIAGIKTVGDTKIGDTITIDEDPAEEVTADSSEANTRGQSRASGHSRPGWFAESRCCPGAR